MAITYKRKRLSSCSGHARLDVFSNLSMDAQAVEEKGLSEDPKAETTVNSAPKDVSSDMAGENIESGLSVENTENPVQEENPSCEEPGLVQHDKRVEDSPDSQLVGGNGEPSVDKPEPLCSDKIVEAGSATPMITFNRRVKKKAKVERMDVLNRLLSDSSEGNTDDKTKKPNPSSVSAKTDDAAHRSQPALGAENAASKKRGKKASSSKVNSSKKTEATGSINDVLDSCNANINEGASAEGVSQLTLSDGSSSKVLSSVQEKSADAMSKSKGQLIIDGSEKLHPSVLRDRAEVAKAMELIGSSSEGIGKTPLNSHAKPLDRAPSSMGAGGSRPQNQPLSDDELARRAKYIQLCPENNAIRPPHHRPEFIPTSLDQRYHRPEFIPTSLDQRYHRPEFIPTSLDQRNSYAFQGARPQALQGARPQAPLTPNYYNVGNQDLFRSSSVSRQQMLLDSIAARAHVMRGDMGLTSLTAWTEDELDYLWVGVRRHGKGNWEAILNDNRLPFNPLRTPMDLSRQWEYEQLRLVNETRASQARSVNPMAMYPDLRASQARSVNPMAMYPDLVNIRQYLTALRDPYYRAEPRVPIPGYNMYTAFDSRVNVPRNAEPPMAIPLSRAGPPMAIPLARAGPPMAIPLSQVGSSYPQNDLESSGPSQAAGEPGDPVILDSDASSEETISDRPDPEV